MEAPTQPSTLREASSRLALLADGTRMRLLSLLDREELTVSELTRATGLPQSRVSTHLGRLREAGMLRLRPEGTSTFYSLCPSVRRDPLWHAVRGTLDDPTLADDRRRLSRVLEARAGEASWVDAVAGRMEHHYSPGRTWEATARALIGLLHLGDVLDVGSGDGVTAALLAPRSASYTCLDQSDRVLRAARDRLRDHPNVRFVAGDMHALPLPDDSFDQVLALNVLTYAEDPAAVLSEAARVLRPAGTLVLVTLAAHAHMERARAYGHVRPGFAPEALSDWARAAGLAVQTCAVTSRERRKPYFEILTLVAHAPAP